MSEPERPDNAMSPDDRELEDFLAGRSDISQRYREDAARHTTYASQDARVLAAAAAPVVRARRWRNLRVPIGLAASLVLVVGVLQLTVNEPAVREPLTSDVVLSSANMASVVLPEQAQLLPSAPEEPASKPAHSPPSTAAPGSLPDQATANERERSARDERAAASRQQAETQRSAKEAARSDKRAEQSTAAEADVYASSIPAPPPPAPASPIVELQPAPPLATSPAREPEDRSLTFSGSTSKKPSASAPAAASLPKPLEAGKPLAFAPKAGVIVPAPSSSPLVTQAEWRPGNYRGLVLGQATQDDVLRRFGPAPVAAPADTNAPLPDGRVRHRLLEYSQGADPRGVLRLYLDANSQVLASAAVTLKPALPLAEVEAQESLTSPVSLRAADAAPCTYVDGLARPFTDPASFPLIRVYPLQGVYLLLTRADTVAEISYFERCR